MLVARARPGRSAVAVHLRALGAEVLEAPDVAVEPLSGTSQIEQVLARRHEFGGIIFGCAAGVEAVVLRFPALDIPVLAVGREAAKALACHGIAPIACARGACEEALAEQAGFLRDREVLLITVEEGRPNLHDTLAKVGAAVEAVAVYRYAYRMPMTPFPPIDLIVLPSSSAARLVLSGEFSKILQEIPMVAIGPRTEQTARDCGAQRVVRSETDTPSSLVSLAVSLMGTT
jgi:uroporphyrinogen III methyltransferase/synthase